ncbi:MAG: lipopolysaccharide heptosyltransferase II [Planctomycetota bacterium]|jgi:heptosyltransferase-2
MQEKNEDILVWLPSPLGDAVLCTPALRAIRERFDNSKITFFAKPIVRQMLSPCSFNDTWLEQENGNPFYIAKVLKEQKFSQAILFKNSFASALAVFLARIPARIGYAREGRDFLLTEKLLPPKTHEGKFKALSMIDYYLAVASWVGADVTNRKLSLEFLDEDKENVLGKLPEINEADSPIVIMVPGGAFGPSKCWPSIRFSKTSDWLISNYNAKVLISIAPEPAETIIAEEIISQSQNPLINLAKRDLNIGELKALFSMADLVICNDTGPRHIAIAFGRKVITMFGPNDPAWTETGHEYEIKIIGTAYCAPCAKPVCTQKEHICMESITTEQVCQAAKELLENNRRHSIILSQNESAGASGSFFINSDYIDAFAELGLTSLDAVFAFDSGKDPGGSKLPRYRNRLEFEVPNSEKKLYLKSYDNPGVLTQIKNWFWHDTRKSMMSFDLDPVKDLELAGIKTPKAVSYGEKWGIFFEKRSFTITEEITNAEPLEKKLPDCFQDSTNQDNIKEQREFIKELGQFARKLHDTGYRHRDFYLAHIFYRNNGTLYLIDLQRAFNPRFLAERFRVKDIAQLYYSAPKSAFSKTDRLRFYRSYTGKTSLDKCDKVFIRKVFKKVMRIVRHDIKHGRLVPFTN